MAKRYFDLNFHLHTKLNFVTTKEPRRISFELISLLRIVIVKRSILC